MGGLTCLSLLISMMPAGELVKPTVQATGSYLYQPASCLDDKLRLPAVPYCIQPGDICLAIGTHKASQIVHKIFAGGLPNHSMIAFATPCGQVAILEAGPNGELIVRAREAMAHLQSYECVGSPVWVRRRCTPLTPEQSACLTQYCMAHDETPFAKLRVGIQATPFRSRMPIRTIWAGKPDPNKPKYFCSELVLNSLIVAGVIDGKPMRPTATYPSDLFYNESRNRMVNRSLRELECDWAPPARWTSCPITSDCGEQSAIQR
jgi:hypothetical protein